MKTRINKKTEKMLLVLTLAICSFFSMAENKSLAQDRANGNTGSHIKLSLNAFSFNDVLMQKATPEKPAFTLMDLLDSCTDKTSRRLT